MALKVNCSRCTDPTCNGQEYTANYDYWDGGRQRGKKIVCESQVFHQGNRVFHFIKTDKHQHRFEAEVIKPEETEIENQTVVNEAGQEALGEDGEPQTERTTALRNQERIHREMPEAEVGETEI